jgi:hypothetical protein
MKTIAHSRPTFKPGEILIEEGSLFDLLSYDLGWPPKASEAEIADHVDRLNLWLVEATPQLESDHPWDIFYPAIRHLLPQLKKPCTRRKLMEAVRTFQKKPKAAA